MLRTLLGLLAAGVDLSREQMAQAIDLLMRGDASEGEVGLLLTSLRTKGETADELAGAALAMRQHMTPIRSSYDVFIDTCGTGGDRSGTFNISTAAAIVTAAAGVPVAKHGNRRVTSATGSADVLTELGVNVMADVSIVERCLAELGLAFCFAPLCHPAMKFVAPVRQKLGGPTIFNLLGPLSNPASAPFQMIGVGNPDVREKMAAALASLNTRRAIVVHGEDGLDELTLAGSTLVSECQGGTVREFRWQPEDFGLARAPLDSIKVENPAASAQIIRQVLQGQDGPARDIVVLNAAAALWTAGKSADPRECARLAEEAIRSRSAENLLARLAELSHQGA